MRNRPKIISALDSTFEMFLIIACLMSGFWMFFSFLEDHKYFLFAFSLTTYVLSLIFRKFITEPNTKHRIGEVGYLLVSFAFTGSLFVLLTNDQDIDAALPIKTLAMIAPSVMVLMSMVAIEKFSSDKDKSAYFLLFMSFALLSVLFYNSLTVFFSRHELILSIIIGCPTIYMATILFGLNKTSKKFQTRDKTLS